LRANVTIAGPHHVGPVFAALEGLMISYQALPDNEREQVWAEDAYRITGATARHLSGSYSGPSRLERIEPGLGGGGRVGLITASGR
jgi:hypothetical protein